MNKTTEALKLAEEALEELHYSSGTVKAVTLYKHALAAIREALAEPELNLNCPSVQARLATVWGYVKAEPDDLDWITPEAVFEAKLKAHGIPNPTAEPVKQEPVACVNGCDTSKGKCADCPDEAPVQPVKQEPIGMVIGGVFEPWNDDVLSGAWELYAAPVDAKAIRAEAYQQGRDDMKEEAAKVCDDESRYSNYADCCADAIRGLK